MFEKISSFLKELFNKPFGPYIFIILIILSIYAVTLNYQLVYLDDNFLIQDYYHFNKDLNNIPQAFREDIYGTTVQNSDYYRPILRLSFMFDAQFGEKNLFFMSHLTNIILHMLVVCLLFFSLKKMNVGRLMAFAFTLLFAMHPVNTQTVSWIPGRNDSLLAIFLLSSFIFFLSYIESKKIKFLSLHILFFTLALFTKETGVMIPILYTLYILFFKGFLYIKQNYKQYTYLLVSWLIASTIYFFMRSFAVKSFVGTGATVYSIFVSIYEKSFSLVSVVGKIFLPIKLTVFPVFTTINTALTDINVIYGVLVLILILLYCITQNKINTKMILFGTAWFLFFMVPTFLTKMDGFPENRIYVPMIGFIFIVLGLNLLPSLENFLNSKIPKYNPKKVIFISIGILVALYSMGVMVRNRHYQNEVTFFTNALDRPLSHNNLGVLYTLKHNLVKAEEEYKKALELNPLEKHAHGNLGLLYEKQGRLEEAKIEYAKEAAVNPEFFTALNNK